MKTEQDILEILVYKPLFKLVEKYTEEASRVFNKLKKADQESKTDILRYGHYSSFRRVEWEHSDENTICVEYFDYGYDIYESESLYIPADILFDDEKIDNWIKSEVDEVLAKKEQQRKTIAKQQEEKERREYERLKEKFEI